MTRARNKFLRFLAIGIAPIVLRATDPKLAAEFASDIRPGFPAGGSSRS